MVRKKKEKVEVKQKSSRMEEFLNMEVKELMFELNALRKNLTIERIKKVANSDNKFDTSMFKKKRKEIACILQAISRKKSVSNI